MTSAAGSCGGPAGTTSAGGAPTVEPSAAASAASAIDGIPQDGQKIGSASAPLTINLYQNFLCPHCRDFALTMLPQLLADYVRPGKVAIQFHDTAFGGGPADVAHEAARCAADQGKFWPAYFAIYEAYSEDASAYTNANMESVLAPTGVDAQKLAACLDSNQHQAEVDATTAEFQNLPDNNPAYANALATVMAQQGPAIPLLDIGGTYITAPENYATVKAAIDAKLNQ